MAMLTLVVPALALIAPHAPIASSARAPVHMMKLDTSTERVTGLKRAAIAAFSDKALEVLTAPFKRINTMRRRKFSKEIDSLAIEDALLTATLRTQEEKAIIRHRALGTHRSTTSWEDALLPPLARPLRDLAEDGWERLLPSTAGADSSTDIKELGWEESCLPTLPYFRSRRTSGRNLADDGWEAHLLPPTAADAGDGTRGHLGSLSAWERLIEW